MRQDVEFPPSYDNQPLLRLPGAVATLVALLIAAHVIPPLVIQQWSEWRIFLFAFIPARLTGIVPHVNLVGSVYWPFLTYALLHGGYVHLAANSLWMIVFGTPVARCLGPARFYVLAILAAIAGALASLFVRWGELTPLIGASGIVSGMVGAAVPVIFAPNAAHRLRSDASPEYYSILPFGTLLQSAPALAFMAVFLAVTLFTGAAQLLLTTAFLDEVQIAWETHLGGFIAGLALIYVLAHHRR